MDKGNLLKRVEALLDNPIYYSIVERFVSQQEKGLKKYGEYVTLDSYDLDGWIEHVQQEKMDELVYLETVKKKYEQLNKN